MLLNNYHANIILTVEVNPYNFLDKNIKIVDGKDETSVYRQPNKMSIHWTTIVPKKGIKGTPVNGDVNRFYQISMKFEHEKETFREKYRSAGFSTKFVGNAIQQLYQKLIDK